MVIVLSLGSSAADPEAKNLVEEAAECASLDPAKCSAFKSLLKRGESAWPLIEKSLASETLKTRAKAARMAARDEFGTSEKRTTALLASVRKIKPSIQGETIEALGRIAHTGAFDTLKAIVADTKKHGRNRIYAVNAIGRYPAEVAVSVLLSALNDPLPRVQQSAAINLGLLGHGSAVGPLINRLLAEITATYVRESATMALAKLKDKKAVGPLVIMLGNPSIRVRQAAIRALTAFGDQSVVPALLTLVNDDGVLPTLMEAFGMLGDKRAAAASAAVANNAQLNINTRLKAIWTLGTLADPRTGPEAIALLEDKALALKRAACECLGRMKLKSSTPALVKLFEHSEEDIRKAALWALQQISGRDFGYTSKEWMHWYNSEG